MLASRVTVSVRAELERSLSLASPRAPLDYSKSIGLADGIDAYEADLVFHDQRILAPGVTEDLFLEDGSLLDAFGAPLVFARLRIVILCADDGNAREVRLSHPGFVAGIFVSSTAAAGVHPGGFLAWAGPDPAGAVVTAGTGDVLTIQNPDSGASAIYDIVLVGASA